jgi:hypothetical protein
MCGDIKILSNVRRPCKRQLRFQSLPALLSHDGTAVLFALRFAIAQTRHESSDLSALQVPSKNRTNGVTAELRYIYSRVRDSEHWGSQKTIRTLNLPTSKLNCSR